MKSYQDLVQKVEQVVTEKKIDLSSGEDLSLGIMNLISIEEHLFFTFQKTQNQKYLDLLDEVRLMRTELLRKIIKDYEGEVWCISKHLLSASMRLMEVGTKELKKGNRKEANEMFDKSFKLYSLFWGINLKTVDLKDISQTKDDISFIDDKTQKVTKASIFDRLNSLVQKTLDCCRE